MRIGAVYVDQAPLATGAEGPGCIAPGVYSAQVPGGVEVDLLETAPQEFSVFGNGTADPGLSWQIWLTDGNINEANAAQMVNVEGVATRLSDGTPFRFGAIVTINDNRLIPQSDPAQPGLNPICKQRIIQVGGIELTPFQGGAMFVTVDPRKWFNLNIDFSTLPLATSCLSSDCQRSIPTFRTTGAPRMRGRARRKRMSSRRRIQPRRLHPPRAHVKSQALHSRHELRVRTGGRAGRAGLLPPGILTGGAAAAPIAFRFRGRREGKAAFRARWHARRRPGGPPGGGREVLDRDPTEGNRASSPMRASPPPGPRSRSRTTQARAWPRSRWAVRPIRGQGTST